VVEVVRRGFPRKVDALDEIFLFLGDFVERDGIDDRSAFTIKLVVEELFTNMVRHNTGGDEVIDVGVERDGDRIRLQLVDTGVDRFDPSSIPEPPVDAGIDERRPGGLGLYLVQTMVDDVTYSYEPAARRMRVSVVKKLEI
jgi:anti-sigma regulatory factor (Ser/Thr protein kinase)